MFVSGGVAMSCHIERCIFIWGQVDAGCGYLDRWLPALFSGEHLWAQLAIAAIMAPVAGAFVWVQYIWVPKFVKWYYDQSIAEKALDWFTKQGLAFLGFRHSTALISVIAGV